LESDEKGNLVYHHELRDFEDDPFRFLIESVEGGFRIMKGRWDEEEFEPLTEGIVYKNETEAFDTLCAEWDKICAASAIGLAVEKIERLGFRMRDPRFYPIQTEQATN